MKVIRTAATRQDIPNKNVMHWVPPSDAILLQHVFLRNDSSPLRKWYSVRAVAFNVEGMTDTIVVTMAYWGADGVRARSQVKDVARYGNRTLPSTLWGLRHLVETKQRGRAGEPGYVVIKDQSYPAADEVMPEAVAYDYGRDMTSPQSSPQPAPRPAITPPTAPTMTPTYNNPTAKPKTNDVSVRNGGKNKPTKEEMEAAFKARIQASVVNNMDQLISLAKQHNPAVRESISKIVNDYQNPNPANDPETKEVLKSPTTLGLVRQLLTTAIMDGLFIDLWQITPEFLDMIGADQQVKDKVHKANDLSAYQDLDFGDDETK
jgi:hypothetical protein